MQCRYGIVGMGVADGVYAWKERGIDAGLFSRTLMSTARQEVDSGTDDVVKCKALFVLQQLFSLLQPAELPSMLTPISLSKTGSPIPLNAQ